MQSTPKKFRSLGRAFREGDSPQELIVDPETLPEAFASTLGCVGVMFALAGGFYLGLHQFHIVSEAKGAGWGLLAVGLPLIPIGIFLRSKIDIHFKIDLENKLIRRYQRIHIWESLKPVAEFSQIAALAVDMRRSDIPGDARRGGEKLYRYFYGLMLILKSGSKVRLLERNHQDFNAVRTKAQELADLFAVPLHAEEQKFLKIKRGTQGPQVSFRG